MSHVICQYLLLIFFSTGTSVLRPYLQLLLLLYHIQQKVEVMEWSGGIRTTTSAAGSCRAAAAPLRGDALLAAMQ
jgi:hypothetical protein